MSRSDRGVMNFRKTNCVRVGKIALLFVRACKLHFGIPPESGSARLGHIPSLPGKPQLPLKPCVSLQPFYFERQLRFLRFSLRFQCVLINTSVKGDSLSPLTIPLRRAEPARPQFACGSHSCNQKSRQNHYQFVLSGFAL